ncbi:MAG: cyclic nucleotide-binding domain-containing protein [Dokdonella sp.]
MSEHYRIAIVGSGPGGLSAAARAAERKLPHLLLEAAAHLSNTIFRYQRGKFVMAEPGVLPLRAAVPFEAGTREDILEAWNATGKKLGINVRRGMEVTAIERDQAGGGFTIRTSNGTTITADTVVLGIGLQGNLRKLGVPGEDFEFVQYQLDDPGEYVGETIAVVGAGDAAIENAIALAANNRVIVVNRRDEFARAKEGNLLAMLKAIEDGRIECHYGSAPLRVECAEGAKPGLLVLETPKGETQIPIDRLIARLGATAPRAFVEACGVQFPSNDPVAVPQLSPRYESNVPGLYIVGALGGYPLIKQAMNQGYEVVEYIVGAAVEPADAPLLKAKFAGVVGFRDVDAMIARIQGAIPLFADVGTLQLRELLLGSDIRTPKAGEPVFLKNDFTDTFFSILDGTVEIDLPDRKQRPQLGRGEFFGEMSLISGRRRSATVLAGAGCVLIETPRRTIMTLINSNAAVKAAIDRAFIQRAVQSRLFPEGSTAQLAELVAGARIERYKAGDVLFREGEDGDCLHLVRSGSLTISREIGGREVVLSYVPAGNYVGEMALLGNSKRSATARAAIATETIRLDGAAFNTLVRRVPLLKLQLQKEYRDRTAANVAMQSMPDDGDIISFLISQGAGEATDILLIDESLCVRCNHCERACAETHGGHSRLNREAGATFAQVHVPTSCRHCEHPHCMKDCPPDAIHRAPNGEVFIGDNCIGCGNCERNCPYGVIAMAGEDAKPPSLLAWLATGFGRAPGDPPAEKKKGSAKSKSGKPKKAVKCDMCKDQPGGAACVRACPTGAAIRITPEAFPAYARSRR